MSLHSEAVDIYIFFDEDPEILPLIREEDVGSLLYVLRDVLLTKSQIPVLPQFTPYQSAPYNDPNRIRIEPAKIHHSLVESLEAIEGCIAIEIRVTAHDVWNQIGILQDQIYNPESDLSALIRSHRMKLHPCRAAVKEARVSYGHRVSELHKEEAHLKLAAIAAKQTFFRMAKLEIATREALADSYAKAEASKEQLDKMSAMFDEIAATSSDPEQIKKALNLLRASHEAVQHSSRTVTDASEKAIKLHENAEAAKMAAYLCAARTGVTESYQDWAQREFLFAYLPKNRLPSNATKLKFVDEREKAIQAEIRSELAKTRLSLVEKDLKHVEDSKPYDMESQTQRLRKLQDEAQRLVAEERDKATRAANQAILLYQESLAQGGKSAALASFVPSSFSAKSSSSSLYMCSLGTGFIGTFEEVEAHEKRVLAQRQATGYSSLSSPPTTTSSIKYTPYSPQSRPVVKDDDIFVS